ncbi:UvrD-helicase domain-containing protein [Rhizobium laguerreae]|uniref:poly-gamma-glutamate hydrolase family protein n=1 Tax=Rhizobium laguerreae TaxID=1076926 RepID=UPI001C9054A7|nr:poly-gamma-glutamate hydrolase family protein [Rhizobium laguerreae]MBY3544787.1 UvrD-helicase domain-containing protein [Rhizobium laguerreae]MBY3549244.1 UvrD-helicase domain-containing protein [Rhizobium laguerreae]
MTSISPQQQHVVDRPMGRLCVLACAGSGKTRTVVHRVAKLQGMLNGERGRIALLSFSNVAVDTFRRDYRAVQQEPSPDRKQSLVDIATFDSFFTTNVLRPHGHRSMGCKTAPFLVHGSEPFMGGFTLNLGKFPQGANTISATFENGTWQFFSSFKNSKTKIDTKLAAHLVNKLGKIGAYTHEFGRYWSYRVLTEQAHILRALVRRYPQIVIDEAQDIGPSHEALLNVLAAAGSTITLVGDVNQGIFEFNGADGRVLADYYGQTGVDAQELTINFRSVPKILKVANSLAERSDQSDRSSPALFNGAFFTTFRQDKREELFDLYRTMLEAAGVPQQSAVVLCRGNEWVNNWRRSEPDQGRGSTKYFAQAAVLRDRVGNFDAAFGMIIRGLLGLVENPPADLATQLHRPGADEKVRAIRRILWKFLRDEATGLPAASLPASTHWQPLLLARIKGLLDQVAAISGIVAAANIGNRLSKADLLASPLAKQQTTSPGTIAQIRVETVHAVKGESIDAVMYVASKEHARELIAGPNTEVGRIGYVALTRARNLFLLAIPEGSETDFAAALEAHGVQRYPSSGSSTADQTTSVEKGEVTAISDRSNGASTDPEPSIGSRETAETPRNNRPVDSSSQEPLAVSANNAAAHSGGDRSTEDWRPPEEGDWYANFAQLSAREVENIDYSISVVDKGSAIAVVAPHGGFIEPGTSQIAQEIAGENFSSYILSGLRSGRHHRELHITSSKFDEKSCLDLLSRTKIVLGIHGRSDGTDAETIFLGGLDLALKSQIEAELQRGGFKSKGEGHRLPGVEPDNICNRGTAMAGVQLEVPRTLRDRLVADSALRARFAECVRSALGPSEGR